MRAELISCRKQQGQSCTQNWRSICHALHMTAVGEHSCFIRWQMDSNNNLRWTLPLDDQLRCQCTKVIADRWCGNSESDQFWFTDYPGLLADRSVWNTEKLKYLLDCSYQDVDECIFSPCLNGASCVDGLFEYTCFCPAGYKGRNCAIDIDECNSDPCQIGWMCEDGINEFSCACPPGYEGDNCEMAICSPVCDHGGTCVAPNECSCPFCPGGHCGTGHDGCPGPFGLEDGSIENSQITASSYYDKPNGNPRPPWDGRLNNDNYWATLDRVQGEWIQVDFKTPVTITGIQTQGRGGVTQWIQWVTHLTIQTGNDTNSLAFVMENNIHKIFSANVNNDDVVNIIFPEVIVAQYVRVNPTAWHDWIAMRMEVLGYP